MKEAAAAANIARTAEPASLAVGYFVRRGSSVNQIGPLKLEELRGPFIGRLAFSAKPLQDRKRQSLRKAHIAFLHKLTFNGRISILSAKQV
jgi:hypothetical protein